jgi:hypothetical protein
LSGDFLIAATRRPYIHKDFKPAPRVINLSRRYFCTKRIAKPWLDYSRMSDYAKAVDSRKSILASRDSPERKVECLIRKAVTPSFGYREASINSKYAIDETYCWRQNYRLPASLDVQIILARNRYPHFDESEQLASACALQQTCAIKT